MVDPSDKISSEPDGVETKKCEDCGTSKTPLWRSGPNGPKTLCNACGIKSRKRRRAVLGYKSEEKKTRKSSKNFGATSASRGEFGGSTLHQRLLKLGKDAMTQKRSRSTVENRPMKWRKLGEEEQAAVLLMALSYGSVYA